VGRLPAVTKTSTSKTKALASGKSTLTPLLLPGSYLEHQPKSIKTSYALKPLQKLLCPTGLKFKLVRDIWYATGAETVEKLCVFQNLFVANVREMLVQVRTVQLWQPQVGYVFYFFWVLIQQVKFVQVVSGLVDVGGFFFLFTAKQIRT
jgi:hypothetical protein